MHYLLSSTTCLLFALPARPTYLFIYFSPFPLCSRKKKNKKNERKNEREKTNENMVSFIFFLRLFSFISFHFFFFSFPKGLYSIMRRERV